jgi:hypothetical protein
LIVVTITAVATVGVTLGAAVATVGAVGAATPLKVECTGLTGEGGPGTPVYFSGCSGSGVGITGSTGTEMFNTPAGGESQVTWATAKTITDGSLKFDYNAPHSCAPMSGYEFVSAVHVTGAVGGGTGSARRLNGGRVSQHFCQYVTGDATNYLMIGYGVQRE